MLLSLIYHINSDYRYYDSYRYEVENYEEMCLSKKSIPWLCCMPKCRDGVAILERCKFGVLQYTLIRGLTSFVA